MSPQQAMQLTWGCSVPRTKSCTPFKPVCHGEIVEDTSEWGIRENATHEAVRLPQILG